MQVVFDNLLTCNRTDEQQDDGSCSKNTHSKNLVKELRTCTKDARAQNS